MEIKINKEIKDYNETMFFGLSTRQFIFALLACAAAVGIYFGGRYLFRHGNAFVALYAHPKGAIQIRNRDMIDRSDLVICYIDHKSGGAYQSVKYAKKVGIEVLNVQDIK